MRGVKEIGDDKVSDEVVLKIKWIVDREEKEKVKDEYRIGGEWMRKKVKRVLYGKK